MARKLLQPEATLSRRQQYNGMRRATQRRWRAASSSVGYYNSVSQAGAATGVDTIVARTEYDGLVVPRPPHSPVPQLLRQAAGHGGAGSPESAQAGRGTPLRRAPAAVEEEAAARFLRRTYTPCVLSSQKLRLMYYLRLSFLLCIPLLANAALPPPFSVNPGRRRSSGDNSSRRSTMAAAAPQTPPSLTSCSAYAALQEAKSRLEKTHLRELLKDEHRNDLFFAHTEDGIWLDFSRQKLDPPAFGSLISLAKERQVPTKIKQMFEGAKLNNTENRAVLHVALRMPQGSAPITVDDEDVIPQVHAVLKRIKTFVERVRGGTVKGHTGKPLKDVVSIGIGGSYLGAEFVATALAAHHLSAQHAEGRQLHFLANVDPVDVYLSKRGFNPETTLVVIISKTFTTAETLKNAHSLRQWILQHYKGDEKALSAHFCAVSTNLEGTSKFGILPERVFAFWDWVGGRYSVTSAVGVLPLALQYGWDVVDEFLKGAHTMDVHFKTSQLETNLPVLMGLVAWYNSTVLGYESIAVLPYSQALARFPAHIQQLTMESNGKRVTAEGAPLKVPAGEIYFGEPGTNAQHSFFQLMHQGRVIPGEFIGFCKSQQPLTLPDDPVSNHDELMSNFFAQPDALAFGKDESELKKEGLAEKIIPHKIFPGDRPSLLLLMPEASPYYIGQLLALYEHRTAVEGWLWGVNSFDQWGVELGKALAKGVRGVLQQRRAGVKPEDSGETALCSATRKLLNQYLKGI